MSAARDQRVDDALQQLVSRLVPSSADDPEDDPRWDESLALARRLTDSPSSPTSADTAAHAADLIRAKLLRDTGRPDKATRFSGLYSRLLTQPVLGQKWAILYFLYALAEPDMQAVRERLEEIGDAAGHTPSATRGDRETGGAQRERRGDAERERRRVGRETPLSPPPQPRRRREAHDDPPLPKKPAEAALLRDLPFVLQGLASTHLPFRDGAMRIPPGLPLPMVGLLHQLAEPALLYRHLAAYVESDEGGLVGQGLRSAIGEELRSYLGLVATLEGQVRKALGMIDEEQSTRSLGKAGVTLKRCVVWTREATLGLRLMSMIVEEATGKKGGPLITLIHTLSTSHGDPFVHTFATRLLHKVTRPFYSMLQHWVFSGDLHDPYSEFFVTETPSSEETSATAIWTDKFTLDETLIPSVLPLELAKKVFLIGKSLNFIRISCSDATWVEQYTASSSRELSFSDPATLSSSIEAAYKATTARVLELMATKFQLFDHLSALKKYLLLGAGDFIAILLESLASNLDGPANAQYRHHLTSALDHSIRNSNAQFDSQDMTRRLDARMLELSHGEIGWDVFTLEYRMDSPLDVVVGPWAQKQYLKIFNFLWRIKRVEFSLSQMWGKCTTGSRGVLRCADDDAALKAAWKRARTGLAAMVHFIGQLQYYILFEVIEAGWEALLSETKRPDATLDTIIVAHKRYLTAITKKGLLADGTADFTPQLHEILKVMLAFRDALEALYAETLARFAAGAERARRTERGQWGTGDIDPVAELIPLGEGRGKSAAERIAETQDAFGQRVEALLGDLAYAADADMRFLGVVMNFNDTYKVRRRKR